MTSILSATLWGAIFLWTCFEVLNLYVWMHKLPEENIYHYRGRLESVGVQARLAALGIFIGSLGVGSMTLALLYSKRMGELSDKLREQRGMRLEAEEMGLAAAGLAHETKNPLGLMRGMAQRIATGTLSQEETQRLASDIVEQADLTSSRLSDFLRYAGVRHPAIKAVDALPVLDKLVSLLEPEFLEAGVLLDLTCPPTTIEADPEMLSQIMMNLLVNALKFTPRGGKVSITLERKSKGKCSLTVSDNGAGMPEDVVPNIFKPYFSRRAGGCGLGLAIVKRMAESSGWDISVKSVEGKGTTIALDNIAVKKV